MKRHEWQCRVVYLPSLFFVLKPKQREAMYEGRENEEMEKDILRLTHGVDSF
jgi:hypothetical protein